MKKMLFICLMVSQMSFIFAQSTTKSYQDRPHSNINLCLVGDASLLSVNYEHLFFFSDHVFMVGKAGLGYNESDFLYYLLDNTPRADYYVTIPHHVSVNIGQGRFFGEIGMGGTYTTSKVYPPANPYYVYPIVGLRLQPLRSNRINLRLFVMPNIIKQPRPETIVSSIGLHMGWSL